MTYELSKEDHQLQETREYNALTSLANRLHQAQVDKGFWEVENPGDTGERLIDQKLMLLVGELSEAHEELRSNNDPYHTYEREDGKPEGFLYELADVQIRLMDLVGSLKVDFGRIVAEKHAFNQTRPHKHGRLY